MHIRTSALITSRSNQLGSKNAAIAPVLRATEDYKSPSALFQTRWLSASAAWNKIILKTEMKEQRREMQRGKGRALSSMCFVLCEEWQDNGEQSTRRSAQRGEAGRNRDGVKLRQKQWFHPTVRHSLHKHFPFFLIVTEMCPFFPIYGKPQTLSEKVRLTNVLMNHAFTEMWWDDFLYCIWQSAKFCNEPQHNTSREKSVLQQWWWLSRTEEQRSLSQAWLSAAYRTVDDPDLNSNMAGAAVIAGRAGEVGW